MKLIFTLFSFLFISTIFAADSVQVQGSCQIKVVPDRGMMSFTAENQNKNQKDAVKKSNDQISLLKLKLSELKLKDMVLKTTNYNVSPVREYEKDKLVDKGTKASLTLEITTSDIARLDEALFIASEVGIQNVGALQTLLSLEKSQDEYLKCLDIASDDAKKKAQQLAKRLGFGLGGVIEVIETPSQAASPQPLYVHGAMMLKSGQRDTRIEAGEQQFSTTIQVSFKIK